LTQLYIEAKKVIKSLLAGVDAPKDYYFILVGCGRMSVPRFRPSTFNAADFEPQVAQERILKDIIHRVMSIPTPYHIHHIVAHDSRMPKPIQWYSAFSLDQTPLVLFIAQFEFVEIIVSGLPIIAPEHIHRTFIKHRGMVRTR
jgi:hypothetical protein